MLRVLSLGAGVQSTTLALLAKHGEIGPMPDAAIFADTQAEPAGVYAHLRWLTPLLPFPVHVVTAGDLRAQILSASAGRTRNDGRPPLFIRNPNGGRGILRRQCTDRFKIIPIEREVRRLLGLRRGQHWPKEPVVEQWVGISMDEILRIKPSRRPAIVRRHPLVEIGMTRAGCKLWMTEHGYPEPPRSACTFCPFHNDVDWRRMKREDPESFADACAIDQAVRSKNYIGQVGEAYLHYSLVPLAEVDFSTPEERGQINMFNNECEGICGV